MRARLRFSKLGKIRFTSHRDVARVWEQQWTIVDIPRIRHGRLFKPLRITATLAADARADFRLNDPGWLRLRRLDDLIPDHGHLMHLFLVRGPAMDEVFHLHPEQTATGFFSLDLPSLPAGDYRVYGDIVHENGFAETAVGDVTLPQLLGKPLSGDDSGGAATADLGRGYRMVWLREQKIGRAHV